MNYVFDRDQARRVLEDIEGVTEYNWPERLDPYIDRLAVCVRPVVDDSATSTVTLTQAELVRVLFWHDVYRQTVPFPEVDDALVAHLEREAGRS